MRDDLPIFPYKKTEEYKRSFESSPGPHMSYAAGFFGLFLQRVCPGVALPLLQFSDEANGQVLRQVLAMAGWQYSGLPLFIW